MAAMETQADTDMTWPSWITGAKNNIKNAINAQQAPGVKPNSPPPLTVSEVHTAGIKARRKETLPRRKS